MTLATLKYRLQRWLRLTLNPRRYYIITMSDMGIEATFYSRKSAYDAALLEVEADHEDMRIETYLDGDIE